MAGTPVLQTALKTIEVLEALAREDAPGVSLARTAEVLGWSRAATHQYLTSLVHAGWLEQDSDRRYRLGSGAALFARVVTERGFVPGEIVTVMDELVASLQEPISFAVLHGDEAIIIERREPQRSLIHRNPERHLSMTSASGRILLAFDRRTRPEAFPQLSGAIEAARKDGYALIQDVTWMGDDVEAIAVPVMRGDTCLGALSVIAPSGRMPLREAAAELLRARVRIEDALG